ncbi:hypothetical protein [Sphingomonas oryzagri]
MRTFILASVLLTLPIAACDKAAPGGQGTAAGHGGATIPCALAGSEAFKPDCTVERATTADGIVLTLHHPDGGFRRLQVATDGRGVVAADGADVASVKVMSPGSIEVAIGEDRYRLPATVKGRTAGAQ